MTPRSPTESAAHSPSASPSGRRSNGASTRRRRDRPLQPQVLAQALVAGRHLPVEGTEHPKDVGHPHQGIDQHHQRRARGIDVHVRRQEDEEAGAEHDGRYHDDERPGKLDAVRPSRPPVSKAQAPAHREQAPRRHPSASGAAQSAITRLRNAAGPERDRRSRPWRPGPVEAGDRLPRRAEGRRTAVTGTDEQCVRNASGPSSHPCPAAHACVRG